MTPNIHLYCKVAALVLMGVQLGLAIADDEPRYGINAMVVGLLLVLA